MPGSLGTPRYRELIKRLIAARSAAGLTQAEVAEKLSKPQSFVAKYERNERRLDAVELMDICKVINADYETILADL